MSVELVASGLVLICIFIPCHLFLKLLASGLVLFVRTHSLVSAMVLNRMAGKGETGDKGSLKRSTVETVPVARGTVASEMLRGSGKEHGGKGGKRTRSSTQPGPTSFPGPPSWRYVSGFFVDLPAP